MTRQTKADQAIRDAAAEIRRETGAAAAEVRIELGSARRETGDALREAMTELRGALREIWDSESSERPSGSGSGRMSRAQRKEMTRELLLDAAIEVFAERGYHGASLDDVADAAGFTKGAVYSNFSRKSDLFGALLEREAGRYGAALAQTVESAPLTLLPDMAAELLAAPESDQEARTLMLEFWLAAVRDSRLRPRLLQATTDVSTAFDAKIQESDTDPGLTGRELALIFDALVTGLLMNRALDPQGDQPAVLAKALRRILADAAGSDDPSEGEPLEA